MLLEVCCVRSALKKKVYCQVRRTRKKSKSTKMPPRSSFAQSSVSNTRPVPSGRPISAAEAAQGTAPSLQAVRRCCRIRSGLPRHQSGLINSLLLLCKPIKDFRRYVEDKKEQDSSSSQRRKLNWVEDQINASSTLTLPDTVPSKRPLFLSLRTAAERTLIIREDPLLLLIASPITAIIHIFPQILAHRHGLLSGRGDAPGQRYAARH